MASEWGNAEETDLGAKLNAIIGTIFDLIIDNTNGNANVLIEGNTNATISLISSLNYHTSYENNNQTTNGLTFFYTNMSELPVSPTMVFYGAGGLSRWTFIFNSPTNYVVSRTA